MRSGLLIFAIAITIAGCGGAPDRPSILLVTIDTLRADAVGAYGNAQARTPRLDALAAEGLRFTRVWTVCPLTLPAHTTLLTGLLPPEHGFRDNDPPSPLPKPDARNFATLAETFRDAGYETGAFVSASVVSKRTGIDQGFETWDEPAANDAGSLRYAERPGGETAERAARWLGSREGPWFAWVHLFDPHEPYAPPIAFRSGAPLGSVKSYHDEVAYADRCLGMVLDAIAPAGTDVLVAVTADHGEGLGEHGEPTHGYLLYETTLHVPLILCRPGRLPAGTKDDEPASLADLPATLLAEAGLPVPDGRRSLLAKGERPIPTAESLYGYRLMGWAQLYAAREKDEKLVRGAGPSCFDLAADPDETNPLSKMPADLSAAIERYRVIESAVRADGPAIEKMAGLPYLGRVGRGRLAPIPWTENEERREPVPGLAAALDRAKGAIGRDAFEDVADALAELEEKDPGNPSIAFWSGRNAEAAGRSALAARYFGAAFERGLTDARVLYLRLKTLLEAGDVETARRVVEDDVQRVAADAPLLVIVGAFWERVGNQVEAERCGVRAEALARTEEERKLVSRFRHKPAPKKDQ